MWRWVGVIKEDSMEKLHNLLNLKVMLLAVLAVALAACGGGGGGGGGSGVEPAVYSGNTSAALVTAANAHDLALDAYSNSNSSSASMPGFAASLSPVVSRDVGLGFPSSINVMRSALSLIEQVSVKDAINSSSFAKAIITETESFPGSCGGTAKMTLSLNDQTGVFTGNIRYSSYCELEVLLTGDMTMSGQFDFFTEWFDSMTLSYGALRVQALGVSATLTGSIEINDFSNLAGVLDMAIRDDATNEVYQIEDMLVAFDTGAGYLDMILEGRFYDPELGYLDIETVTELRVYADDVWPSSGEFIGTGGNNTKVRFVAFSSTYLIEADTTGDMVYDYSETFNWLQ